MKQLMSFDPNEWTESLRKEYVLVIEGFFTVPLPIFSTTYRRAIQVPNLIYIQTFFLFSFLKEKKRKEYMGMQLIILSIVYEGENKGGGGTELGGEAAEKGE